MRVRGKGDGGGKGVVASEIFYVIQTQTAGRQKEKA